MNEREFMESIHYGEIDDINDYVKNHVERLSSTLEYFDALCKDHGLTELKTLNSRIKSTVKVMKELSEEMDKHLIENALDVEIKLTFKHLSDNKENTRDFIVKIAEAIKPILEHAQDKQLTAKINGEDPPCTNWGRYGWENL